MSDVDTNIDPQYRALLAEVKLAVTEHMDVLQEKSDRKIEELLENKLRPLILETARKSSELAAEKAIRKYCVRINVDYDNVEHMREHSLDMEYLRKSRKRNENFIGTIFTTLAKLTTIGFIAVLIARYFPDVGK